MMQIIYVVMAIALLSLVTLGGVSYFSSDAPLKALTSRGLVAQYETITAGIVSYRTANNGITPGSLDQFIGFLPEGRVKPFGPSARKFEWSVETPEGQQEPVICLTLVDPGKADRASVNQFAAEVLKRENVDITIGENCGVGAGFDETEPTTYGETAVVTVRGF